MLLESGDLIPVLAEAIEIPWTKRKNQVMNFLHRGAVTFQTLVYDTNVGDISPLSTYFNPQKWTVDDLNQRFGQLCDEDSRLDGSSPGLTVAPGADVKSATLTPRLVLYPEVPKSSTFLHQSLTEPIPDQYLSVSNLWKSMCDNLLPSPPQRSPENRSLEDNCEPIGPPKRRRLCSTEVLSGSDTNRALLKPRPASTSSPWTPLFSHETFSPFLTVPLESTALQLKKEPEPETAEEETLACSLRKMAQAFRQDNEWAAVWK